MSAYARYGNRATATPQTIPIPGREHQMMQNDAGGFGFKRTDWDRLYNFCVLGSESGTYYVGSDTLTEQNAAAVIRCIKEDGGRAALTAYDVNINNRAPKVDAQLFVMALALKYGDDDTRMFAAAHVPDMLRTGTHLLHFVSMIDSLGGWNRTKRRIIANWFTSRDADKLAYQMLKYQNRDGWRMADVLRLVHPEPPTIQHNALFRWAVGKEAVGGLPDLIYAYKGMQGAIEHRDMDPVEAAEFAVVSQKMPREALPTETLKDIRIWNALLPSMPPHQMLRNLANMTRDGVFTWGANVSLVLNTLGDAERLRKARVHPFAVMLAALTYNAGRGARGTNTWEPDPRITRLLDETFELTLRDVVPTNKRILVGIDVSGSMDASVANSVLSAAEAASVMAFVIARTEPHAQVVQFDTTVRAKLNISDRSKLSDIISAHGGGTDLSAPVKAALHDKSFYDAFVILTDNETWAGGYGHPTQALAKYRSAINKDAKLVCCSFTANRTTIVDPDDALQFGCAGLDANIAGLVADFIR
jgi:60 kDa SS-A/Ro ribonucleoprotein